MATRSRIGIENEDGTIECIYCHWDGYPEHTGNILNEHYTSEAKVRELMALGDISYIAPEIGEKHSFDKPRDGWTVAYGRDRGEGDTESIICKDLEAFIKLGEDYQYLFTKNKQWKMVSTFGKPA